MTQTDKPDDFGARLTRQVGKLIKHARNRAGVSAEKLAAMCTEAGLDGVTRNVIASVESGRRGSVSVAELVTIADVLSVPPITLLYPVTIDPLAPTITRPGAPENPVRGANWFSGHGSSDRLARFPHGGRDIDDKGHKYWPGGRVEETADQTWSNLSQVRRLLDLVDQYSMQAIMLSSHAVGEIPSTPANTANLIRAVEQLVSSMLATASMLAHDGVQLPPPSELIDTTSANSAVLTFITSGDPVLTEAATALQRTLTDLDKVSR